MRSSGTPMRATADGSCPPPPIHVTGRPPLVDTAGGAGGCRVRSAREGRTRSERQTRKCEGTCGDGAAVARCVRVGVCALRGCACAHARRKRAFAAGARVGGGALAVLAAVLRVGARLLRPRQTQRQLLCALLNRVQPLPREGRTRRVSVSAGAHARGGACASAAAPAQRQASERTPAAERTRARSERRASISALSRSSSRARRRAAAAAASLRARAQGRGQRKRSQGGRKDLRARGVALRSRGQAQRRDAPAAARIQRAGGVRAACVAPIARAAAHSLAAATHPASEAPPCAGAARYAGSCVRERARVSRARARRRAARRGPPAGHAPPA
jgi:hypothetical protein